MEVKRKKAKIGVFLAKVFLFSLVCWVSGFMFLYINHWVGIIFFGISVFQIITTKSK